MAIARDTNGVTSDLSTENRTSFSFSHTCEDDSLQFIVVGCRGADDLSAPPTYNGVSSTLIQETGAGGGNPDAHLYTFAILVSTGGNFTVAGNYDGTVGSDGVYIFGYTGTETASIAAAVNFLSVTDNNVTGTNSNIHASAGTSGNTLLISVQGRGADMAPTSFDNSFSELYDDPTGPGAGPDSALAGADLLAGAPSAVTATFSAIDENVGHLLEIVPAATGGTTVDIPTGSLSLSGFVPDIQLTANLSVDVPVGALNLTGLEPVVIAQNDIAVEIPTGSLSLTGFAPLLMTGADISVDVPTGALSLSGLAPIIQATDNLSVEIPTGSLLLSGFAPLVEAGNDVVVDVPTGSLSLNGFVPSVILNVDIDIEVPTGALSFSGFAPAVDIGGLQVEVPAGALSLLGLVPTVIAEGAEIWTVQANAVTIYSKQANETSSWVKQ